MVAVSRSSDDECNDYDVRLVGVESSYMGLVESCYHTDINSPKWGPLCAFDGLTWSKRHAERICQFLHLPHSGMTIVLYPKLK